MASLINCLSILVIPLLVTSLFYQVSVGRKLDDPFLWSLCETTIDPNFWFSTLKKDPRTFKGSADLNHLGLVTIAIVIDTISRDANASYAAKDYNGAKTHGLIACDKSYNYPPVRTSPIADALTKVIKKYDISVVVFNAITA
ncbi:hypothetical protein CFP56_022924 [Quercus suber]|uniref:Uncharacterized protein n=1 Tax=Quercus suber TaxID=58331 RepID=A0AAW0KAQ7_QUESU